MRTSLASHPIVKLDTITTTAAGQQYKINFEKLARKGFVYTGLLFKIVAKVTAGVAVAGRTKETRSLVQKAFGSFNLYSTKDPSRPMFEKRCDGGHVRIWANAVSKREVADDFLGVAHAVAAETETLKMILPFRRDGQGMGFSQFKTLVLATQEGTSDVITADGPTLSRTAGLAWTVEVWALGYKSRRDPVIAPVTVQFDDTTSSVLDFDECGCAQLLVDTNADHDTATATLTNGFDLEIGGQKVAEQVTLDLVRELVNEDMPSVPAANGANNFINAEGTAAAGGCGVTCMYFPREGSVAMDLPHGKVRWRQYGLQIAAPHLVLYHYPEIGEDVARGVAHAKAAEESAPVMASVNSAQAIGRHAAGAVATASVELISPSDAEFTNRHGLIVDQGGNAAAVVNEGRLAKAKAAIKATPAGDGSQAAAARRVSKLTAFDLPGAVDRNGRSRPTQARSAIREALKEFKAR